ncbi:ATP-binding protein [Halarsenatibacter silvermanii]|uniref:histidine kinase n=1 Tax=Halarsenatibacter silvermanii TaxID=321763 RepID=A0A1G9TE58_9FIRM|nr:sensor histidine kinase [Halarsenatibacter silvermanii]SDM45986.1 two-component system, CitB family, sensor histidine kinase DctS [Halarsenatibacter silvermanii]
MLEKISLKLKISLLTITIICIILIAVGYITISFTRNIHLNRLQENTMDLAQSVSKIPEIQNSLKNNKSTEIQNIADNIRSNTNADFVVIIDMEGRRYSHPYRDRIGKEIVGGDETKVLEEGSSYISRAKGTLGESQRAFVPIFHEGEQVGAVVTGILMEEINQKIALVTERILIALLVGVILGILGAIVLANNIKKSIFGLEPYQIARILEEKNIIIDSIREGIIAINEEGRVSLINKKAKNILKLKKEVVLNKKIKNIIPDFNLTDVLKTKRKKLDKEQKVNDTLILTNQLPINTEQGIKGAVVTFREKNEVQKMAQRLTRTKKLTSSLRSQNHEFMNKLHVISGLIQLGENDRALNFINNFISDQKETTRKVIDNIKVDEIAGLLIGKYNKSKERNVKFQFDSRSNLEGPYNSDVTNRLISILGNLIDNGLESIKQDFEERKLYVGIFEKEREIKILVEDSGVGIKGNEAKAFEKGYTTKKGSRGIGLSLVKENIDILDGTIDIDSEKNNGTSVTIKIPKTNMLTGNNYEK